MLAVRQLDLDKKGVAWNMQPYTGFIDQHPDALRLTVVEGDLDRDQFTLLAGDAFELWGVRVEATVIGASHIVSFHAGSFLLHEVFACVGLNDVSSWALEDLVSEPVERKLRDMRYEFTARQIAWQNPEPSELPALTNAAELCAKAGGIGVVQEFPAGALPVTPKTVIIGYASQDRHGIVIETAHSYPDQGLVLSRSQLHYT